MVNFQHYPQQKTKTENYLNGGNLYTINRPVRPGQKHHPHSPHPQLHLPQLGSQQEGQKETEGTLPTAPRLPARWTNPPAAGRKRQLLHKLNADRSVRQQAPGPGPRARRPLQCPSSSFSVTSSKQQVTLCSCPNSHSTNHGRKRKLKPFKTKYEYP